MPPTGGAKRPSSGNGNGGVGGDKRRRLGVPTEIFIPMVPNPRTMAVGSTGTMSKSLVRRPASESPRIASIDLISKICSFVDVGDGLYKLCIAVGPADAARIRQNYLLNNMQYLSKPLRSLLFRSLAAGLLVSGCNGEIILSYGSHFDKCGDNVKAWMAVNTNWRSYCTEASSRASFEKYKQIAWFGSLLGDEKDSDVQVIFSNPAIVVELGLTDVFRHLVERMKINLTKSLWDGFSFLAGQNIATLASIALRRDDAILLDCLLSAESFGWRDDTHMDGILSTAISQDNVGLESFKMIVAHPKVDVNSPRAYTKQRSPLYSAVNQLQKNTTLRLRMEKVHALLDVGADPHAPWTPRSQHALIPIRVAKNAFLYCGQADRAMWKEIVRKMKVFHQG